jgi:translation elongation factor EF-1alpha
MNVQLPQHTLQLTCAKAVCAELYRDVRQLGRFSMRSGGDTVAVGVITKLWPVR